MTTDLLHKHGFRDAGSCRCDGYYTLKFKKGLYEIKWRKARFKFKVKKGGATITDWLPLEKLETTLNELDKQNI